MYFPLSKKKNFDRILFFVVIKVFHRIFKMTSPGLFQELSNAKVGAEIVKFTGVSNENGTVKLKILKYADFVSDFVLTFQNLPQELSTFCKNSPRGFEQLINNIELKCGSTKIMTITGEQLMLYYQSDNNGFIKLPFPKLNTLIVMSMFSIKIRLNNQHLRNRRGTKICVAALGAFHQQQDRKYYQETNWPMNVPNFEVARYQKPENETKSVISLDHFTTEVSELRIGFFGASDNQSKLFKSVQIVCNQIVLSEEDWDLAHFMSGVTLRPNVSMLCHTFSKKTQDLQACTLIPNDTTKNFEVFIEWEEKASKEEVYIEISSVFSKQYVVCARSGEIM